MTQTHQTIERLQSYAQWLDADHKQNGAAIVREAADLIAAQAREIEGLRRDVMAAVASETNACQKRVYSAIRPHPQSHRSQDR